MCNHVLLALLNHLKRSDEMRGYADHVMAFCHEFNTFDNT